MTVAELIQRLSGFDPDTKVVSYHEDLPKPLTQIQQINGADSLVLGSVRMVVMQGTAMTREWLEPNTP